MRLLWTCGAALLLAAAALAHAEEAGDPSPDRDFFGFWRAIGAEAAPWVKPPRPLRAGEAPLIGWTVEFHDDELRGPPALACTPARYLGAQTALSDVFDRRLDRDKYVEQGAVLGFMAGAETERVICGDGGHRDYYLTHGGDLLIAVGEIIYRLRRPKGDPRDFKAGDSAPGFDCATADNAARKIICLDLRLSALDRQMSEGYKRLAATETPESFATVRAAQSAWFASIARRCDAEGGEVPAHSDDVAVIRDCLADLYPDRAMLLDGVQVVTSGAMSLEPHMRFTMRDKPLFTDTDIVPFLSGGGDAGAAFNTHVAGLLQADSQRIDEKGLFRPKGFPANLALTAQRSYIVARFDSRMISVQIRTNDYTGGTHEQLNEFSIDWDMAKRKPIGFADLFPLDKDGLQFATDYAVKDLARQFGSEPPPRQDDVAHVVGDVRSWLFTRTDAVIHFPVYSVANYSMGEFDVAIPYAALKEYLMPDAAPLARSP